ncbi:uncharacterized protein isoform X2 [Rhodnius prolixus]|uniref:uncharacterized protein isoform X2 n=1 Tax=Rhodnius prolixus TaxID=13249 RepID=UPI003D18AEA9
MERISLNWRMSDRRRSPTHNKPTLSEAPRPPNQRGKHSKQTGGQIPSQVRPPTQPGAGPAGPPPPTPTTQQAPGQQIGNRPIQSKPPQTVQPGQQVKYPGGGPVRPTPAPQQPAGYKPTDGKTNQDNFPDDLVTPPPPPPPQRRIPEVQQPVTISKPTEEPISSEIKQLPIRPPSFNKQIEKVVTSPASELQTIPALPRTSRQNRKSSIDKGLDGAEAIEVETLIIKFNEKLPKCREMREKYEEQMNDENELLLKSIKEEITKTQRYVMQQDVLLIVFECLKKLFDSVDKLQEESFERQKNTLVDYLEAVHECLNVGKEIKWKLKEYDEGKLYEEYVNNFENAAEEQVTIFEQQGQLRRPTPTGKRGADKKEDIIIRVERLLQVYRDSKNLGRKVGPPNVKETVGVKQKRVPRR